MAMPLFYSNKEFKIMKNNFELPIAIKDVNCVTDCWIYNRLFLLINRSDKFENNA